MKILSFILSAILVAGCASKKKREDIAYRFLRENPKVVEDLSRLHFPVTATKGKPVVEVLSVDTQTVSKVDSIVLDSSTGEKKTFSSEQKIIIKTVKESTTDTIVDVALVSSLQRDNLELSQKVNDLYSIKTRIETTSRNRLLWLIGVSVFLTLISAISILGFLKK